MRCLGRRRDVEMKINDLDDLKSRKMDKGGINIEEVEHPAA